VCGAHTHAQTKGATHNRKNTSGSTTHTKGGGAGRVKVVRARALHEPCPRERIGGFPPRFGPGPPPGA